MSYIDTVAVFTSKTADELIRDGYSKSWSLDPKRLDTTRYLVCLQNRTEASRYGEQAAHGSAFFIGRYLKAVETYKKVGSNRSRYAIQFEEYALIKYLEVWKGWRNPVKYTSLSELGIELEGLDFKPVSSRAAVHAGEYLEHAAPVNASWTQPLTIAQAKAGLSISHGVPLDAIKITIEW